MWAAWRELSRSGAVTEAEGLTDTEPSGITGGWWGSSTYTHDYRTVWEAVSPGAEGAPCLAPGSGEASWTRPAASRPAAAFCFPL